MMVKRFIKIYSKENLFDLEWTESESESSSDSKDETPSPDLLKE